MTVQETPRTYQTCGHQLLSKVNNPVSQKMVDAECDPEVIVIKRNAVRSSSHPLKHTQTTQQLIPQKEKGGLERGELFRLTAKLSSLEKYLIALSAVLITAIILVVLVFFMAYRTADTDHGTENICLSSACISTAAQLLSHMDMTADPCEDFFQYSCGGYVNKAVIPDDRSSVSVLDNLQLELKTTLREAVAEPVSPADLEALSKAKLLYASCMNQSTLDALHDAPLHQLLTELGGWKLLETRKRHKRDKTTPRLANILAKIKRTLDIAIFVDLSVDIDEDNSSTHIMKLKQPMFLGMPGRDYFVSEEMSAYLAAYENYMKALTVLLTGLSNRTRSFQELSRILAFEMELAQIMIPEEGRWNHSGRSASERLYISQLAVRHPGFDWQDYVISAMPIQVQPSDLIVVYDTPYIERLMSLLSNTPIRTIHSYALWRVVMGTIADLSTSYEYVDFQFRKKLYGLIQPEPRWQKCVDIVSVKMDSLAAYIIINSRFKEQSLKVALELVSNLKASMRDSLRSASWVKETTKEFALGKLDAVREKIGYPSYLSNHTFLNQLYSKLYIEPEDFFGNVLRVTQMVYEQQAEMMDTIVNPDNWNIPVAVLNAFYNPVTNEIVFPAPIWQPPFFDVNNPRAMNYGGMGVIIGHEITHGFDSKGRHHDKTGNMRQWWDEETTAAFHEQSECMERQYSEYTIDDVDVKFNGRKTLAENIADNGGLKQAFWAYRRHSAQHGEDKRLPGLNSTNDMLFFLTYAQIWCSKSRKESAIHEITQSEHSHAPIRVRGPLSNFEEFAKAYKCKPGSTMNPKNRCSIW